MATKQSAQQIPTQHPGTAKKPAALGIIDPDLVYTLERAAITLGITPRTLRETYINTGDLMAMPFGKSYLIPGYAIHQLVMAMLESCESR